MSNLSQFVGIPACKSIVNAFSTNGHTGTVTTAAAGISTYGAGKVVTSGALTANTLATVLSITGSGGYLNTLLAVSVDATSRTHRVKITLDGIVVFDATSAAIAVTDKGVIPVGAIYNPAALSINLPSPVYIRFNNSCLIEYASSLTETDKTNLAYSYTTD